MPGPAWTTSSFGEENRREWRKGKVEELNKMKKRIEPDRAQWLTPVIPALMGGRGGWITRSRDRDHLGQHGETPSLLKI